MRPGLLFADATDLADVPAHHLADQVAEDLGLAAVIDAMAGADPLIAETARAVLLAVAPGRAQVVHRQEVLTDCVSEPGLPRELYELAGQALDAQRSAARAVFFDTPETLLNQSMATLTSYLRLLRELRTLAEHYRPRIRSAGLTQFFTLIENDLGEAYLNSAESWLGHLKLGGGILVSARLGAENHSEALVMREAAPQARGLFRRGPRSGLPRATYKVPYGDEAGHRALSSLQDQALAGLAGAADRSARQVLSFFAALRTEAGFYVGCLSLRRALTDRGAAVCRPAVREAPSRAFSAHGLYDAGLQLRLDQPAAANDITADGKSLIMVTGANRGGKSTFLRSIGLAQLMATAGMFVAATAFTTAARTGVFTHFTRDEDTTLTSGKFDEELRRMSGIADAIGPHGMLFCNESFQSTNEREGSDIARHIVDAMTEAGVTVVFVTHLNELAHGYYQDRDRFPALFLRAGRDRSFRLHEAAPQPTSHGADLWNRLRTS